MSEFTRQLLLSVPALTASRARSRFTRYFCSCSKCQSQSKKATEAKPAGCQRHHFVQHVVELETTAAKILKKKYTLKHTQLSKDCQSEKFFLDNTS